ncbi:hypothetical protein ACCS91_23655 [Rhizobium ruizarguesonis]|uniref:hypothetical protein n=1 Tax=Rhizobium ruizarguesonis TaxID=2081791 RepID=UPI0010322CDB|nr:hypothetical protein [Rhizobium ruizarguesonis]TAW77434.1 hypothetical protein ELI10_09650 [Rhizobium ruizarguesonis]TAX14400.1 hypothetical protein ELI09_09710 [Rhizobium ruizarguesonis]TAX19231.1 hypothetical protein ELI08_09710 [Rhizobium ruizarguesonis]
MSDEQFDIDSLLETHKRTRIFHDLGEVLVDDIRGGKLFSPPNSVARLLERAFRAGIAFNSHVTTTVARSGDEPRRPQYLVEDELPYVILECLLQLKHGLGWDRESGRYDPAAVGLVLIALPDDPEYPKKLRGRWLNSVGYGRQGISNRAVDRLINLGLYQEPMEMDDGGKVTQMTEWGYELFRLTATRAMDDRNPGASRTFAEYCNLTTCDWSRLYMMVAEKNGFVGEYLFRKPATLESPESRF